MRLSSLLLLVVLTGPLPAAAQTAAARQAAETITEADVLRRIHIIAHDSMGGRWTPSPGLDRTAAYIAAEFRRLGLAPGGDSGTFLQRYAIRQEVVAPAASTLEFIGPDGAIRIDMTRDAVIHGGRGTASGSIVLAGGMPDAAQIQPNALRGKVLVWVGDWTVALPNRLVLQRLFNRMGPAMIVFMVNNDSLLTAQQSGPAPRQTGPAGIPQRPMVSIRESAVLAQYPDAAEALAAMRSAVAWTIEDLGDWTAAATIAREVVHEEFAPNTVGILRGSDPVLRDEYIVYSAHMDHIGRVGAGSCQAMGADSVCNGADDDASGTVGVIEVAEAFARLTERPKRSIIFLTVSGEERGLWGSAYFAANPPVPSAHLVANLNADMIGRNWSDTIVVIGKEHSDLGATLARVSARHPELGLAPIDDLWPEQNFYQRSDHFNFARRGVPVLFFFNGTHPDYHRATDSPEKIDAEKLARVARLMFWVGLDVANAPERPVWDGESYRRYVVE